MVSIKNNELLISEDSTELYKAIADDLMHHANKAVNEKGIFNIALSGGNTPKKLYQTLAKEPYVSGIPWDKIHFFFSDERYIPQDQPDNNYFMAHQYLFVHIPVRQINIYQIPTEYKDPNLAAEDYSATIRSLFHANDATIPSFDLIYLGLGHDAHTASLMPTNELVRQYVKNTDGGLPNQIVAACWIPELNMNRITFTPNLINAAKCVAFLVEGSAKATAVSEVLQGSYVPIQFPAQLIKPTKGKALWFLDEPATAKLDLDK